MSDIFISYKREDRTRTKLLVHALEAQGWSVWWDTELLAGTQWNDAIEKELTDARCVIVAWSKSSAASKWVRDEAHTADRDNKLVPVLFENIEPPLGFKGVEAANLAAWRGGTDDPEFQKLYSSIQAKLKLPPSPSRHVPPQLWPRWSAATIAAGAGAVVVLTGVGLWEWFKPVPIQPAAYQVSVRHAGIGSENAKSMMGALNLIGWKVQDLRAGGENTPEAKGRNEIQYRKNESEAERAATQLAMQVTSFAYGADDLIARPVSTIEASKLEVWISRPEPIAAPPPISPPTPPPPGPVRPRIDVDLANWSSRSPDQAYCMQRKNSDAARGKFLIRCFQTEDLCRGIQRTDSGDRTACAPTTGFRASPSWQGARPGGIQDSWYKYSDQQFPPPFPQFDTPGSEPSGYKVSIRFAGSFDREKDIVPLSQKLRALGWDAQVPRPAGGDDRTANAIGARDVRYSGTENQRAAEVLADAVNKIGVIPGSVKAMASSGIDARELQLWISR